MFFPWLSFKLHPPLKKYSEGLESYVCVSLLCSQSSENELKQFYLKPLNFLRSIKEPTVIMHWLAPKRARVGVISMALASAESCVLEANRAFLQPCYVAMRSRMFKKPCLAGFLCLFSFHLPSFPCDSSEQPDRRKSVDNQSFNC